VLCSTVDYGGTGYIPKDTIERVVYQRTTRETMKDDSHFKEQMLQFFVKYAICTVPKDETRKALIAVVGCKVVILL
jgi:hypothetical protein